MSPQPASSAASIALASAKPAAPAVSTGDGAGASFQRCLDQSADAPYEAASSAETATPDSEAVSGAKNPSPGSDSGEGMTLPASQKLAGNRAKAAQPQDGSDPVRLDPDADRLLSSMLRSLLPVEASADDQPLPAAKGDEAADSAANSLLPQTSGAMVFSCLLATTPMTTPTPASSLQGMSTCSDDAERDADDRSIAAFPVQGTQVLVKTTVPAPMLAPTAATTLADGTQKPAEAVAAGMDSLLPLTAPVVSLTAAPTASTSSFHLASPPSASPAQWAEPLAEHIAWLSSETPGDRSPRIREARIELHPAEWGSLQVRVQLDADGRTQVSFDVETPQARAAIEASLPQLRDLLATQSLNAPLPRFELSGGLSQQPRPTPPAPTRVSGERDEIEEPLLVSAVHSRSGLVDQFA